MADDRQIKFRYIFPEDYNPVYCNGAYGGISTNGEIVANFFLERMPLPNSMTNSISEDGSLSDVIEIDPSDIEKTVIRYISTGIVLSEKSARAIYSWLGTQLEELESRKKLQNSNPQDITES